MNNCKTVADQLFVKPFRYTTHCEKAVTSTMNVMWISTWGIFSLKSNNTACLPGDVNLLSWSMAIYSPISSHSIVASHIRRSWLMMECNSKSLFTSLLQHCIADRQFWHSSSLTIMWTEPSRMVQAHSMNHCCKKVSILCMLNLELSYLDMHIEHLARKFISAELHGSI